MLSHSAKDVGHVASSVAHYSNMFCFVGEVDFGTIDCNWIVLCGKFDKELSVLVVESKKLGFLGLKLDSIFFCSSPQLTSLVVLSSICH